MADLELKDAMILAGQLTTIGHPMMQTGLLATATDLIGWCKGGLFDGRVWTPYEQANVVVQEARLTFGEWAKAGGTTTLLSLFRSKFDPTKLGAARQSIDQQKQAEEWDRLYGPPDPAFAANLLKKPTKAQHAKARKASLWEAIRDTVYYTMGPGRATCADKKFWREALDRHKQRHTDLYDAFLVEVDKYGWDELMAYKPEGGNHA